MDRKVIFLVVINQSETYLELMSKDHQTKLHYHQSNVQWIYPNQQMSNETKQMVVCYELFSLHCEITYIIFYLRMLEEVILTYLMIVIQNNQTYYVDYSDRISDVEQMDIMF